MWGCFDMRFTKLVEKAALSSYPMFLFSAAIGMYAYLVRFLVMVLWDIVRHAVADMWGTICMRWYDAKREYGDIDLSKKNYEELRKRYLDDGGA